MIECANYAEILAATIDGPVSSGIDNGSGPFGVAESLVFRESLPAQPLSAEHFLVD